MCGIAGFVRLGPSPLPPDCLDRMIATLRHRGPDDHGIQRMADVAFGHRRLSIIDLTSAGHQPMASHDGSILLTYNGEIYNYRELDAALKARGYAYRSQSDTETIIHAYEEWGTDCVKRFNGMFSFALWDARRQRLFCARDRFGEKPFYYVRQADRLLFASEIKALLEDPSVPRVPDLRVVCRYVEDNLTDTDTSTFFEAVKILPPAHTLVVDDGRVTIRRYWEPPVPMQLDLTRTEEDWIAEFRETLRSAVALRLRSDVPVGTCLSGGLDSSSIICLMSRLVGEPVSAFSVVYDEPGFREAQFIRNVADAVPLHAHSITPEGGHLLDTLERIVWHNDEPSSSYGQYSQWYVMKLAAEQGVTVILNGQGGDELLGGYERYLPTFVRELAGSGRWRQMSSELRGPMAMQPLAENIKQAVYPLVRPALRDAYRTMITRQMRPLDFVAPEFAERLGEHHSAVVERHASLTSHLMHDLTVSSVPALLHHEDRSSMAFSREIRLPFLDPRLVELAVRMPSSLKIRNGVTKYVLRKAMQGEGVPPAVLNRYNKKGYPTPMGKWFATTAKDEIRELLWSKSFRERGVVDVKKAQAAFDSHVNGTGDFTMLIYQWVSLELWMQRFVDHALAVARTADLPVMC